jgi:epoxyqueuosine reductase
MGGREYLNHKPVTELRHNRPVADTDWIVAQAKQVGFDLCGIAAARDLADLEHRDEWLARGYAGEMRYLHDARRADPARVMPEAQSVIVCAVNYNAGRALSVESAAQAAVDSTARGWVSRYAWGDDYHEVIGAMLARLVPVLADRFGAAFAPRAYVDTGPVSERLAARNAGLGWLAKNTCLINSELGSWLFLCVILTPLALAPANPSSEDCEPTPAPDLCGNCRLCIDACPTGALVEPYVLDARRCISYLTIELRGGIPQEHRESMGWQVFGCDICQDVCPWNRNAPATPLAAFQPRPRSPAWDPAPELAWLLSLDEDKFREVFRRSAVRRAKWRGLVRNACVAAGNARVTPDGPEYARLRARLAEWAGSADALLAEHAQWALARLDRTQVVPRPPDG